MKITPRKQQPQLASLTSSVATTPVVTTSTITTNPVQTEIQTINIKQEPDSKPQIVQIRLAPQTIISSASGGTKTHDTTVLTLPSNIGNIVSINPHFLTQDNFGNYKIDKLDV